MASPTKDVDEYNQKYLMDIIKSYMDEKGNTVADMDDDTKVEFFDNYFGRILEYLPEDVLRDILEEFFGDDTVDGIFECQTCNKYFTVGEEGNELGFCVECQKDKDFPYDLKAYYKDYDAGKVPFKGDETMARGILEAYKTFPNIKKKKKVKA